MRKTDKNLKSFEKISENDLVKISGGFSVVELANFVNKVIGGGSDDKKKD